MKTTASRSIPIGSEPERASQPVNPYLASALRLSAAGFIAANLGIYGFYLPLAWHGVDWDKHWYAARTILNATNTYWLEGAPEGYPLWLGFNYPQWSAMITFWFGWIDYSPSETVWKMMMLAFVAGAWWIAFRLFRPTLWPGFNRPSNRIAANLAPGIDRHWLLTTALIITAYTPIGASCLYVGNIDAFNAFLAMAFIGAFLIGRDRLAGVYWAMFCLVKMMPVVLIVPALLWRRWRLLQGWIAFMAVYFLMLLATGRLHYEWFFVSDMLKEIPFRWRYISVAPVCGLLRLISPHGWFDDPLVYNRAVQISTLIVGSAFVALMAAVRRRGWTFERALEPAFLFIPLLSPLIEDHHMAWILPVFYIHVVRWLRGDFGAGLTVILGLAWGLLCIEYHIANLMMNLGEWSQFGPSLALLMLIGASVWDVLVGKPANEFPRTARSESFD